jgi:hypothetical protein
MPPKKTNGPASLRFVAPVVATLRELGNSGTAGEAISTPRGVAYGLSPRAVGRRSSTPSRCDRCEWIHGRRVFAEGLDPPAANRHLYGQAKSMVADAFRKDVSGGGSERVTFLRYAQP